MFLCSLALGDLGVIRLHMTSGAAKSRATDCVQIRFINTGAELRRRKNTESRIQNFEPQTPNSKQLSAER